MTEYKLFDGDVPYVSTYEFHKDRVRAPHLEQEAHQPRLHLACAMIVEAAERLRTTALAALSRDVTVADLGCGDGGLLSLLKAHSGITAWGYDFAPANQAGWHEREVEAYLADVFDPHTFLWNKVGDIVVTTEVLEHLADPHLAVRRIAQAGASYLVASSPWTEHAGSHDECHAWAWDLTGYRDLLERGGWRIQRAEQTGPFQVVLAEVVAA